LEKISEPPCNGFQTLEETGSVPARETAYPDAPGSCDQ
jgi:hypothetical protein